MNLTVLKVCAGAKPEVVTIPHTLKAMQEIVGGTIQAIYPFEDAAALVCNDEGKLMGLPLNRAVRDPDTGTILDIIAGTFFICGLGDDDFASLTKAQIDHYTEVFRYPEIFLQGKNQIVILQAEV